MRDGKASGGGSVGLNLDAVRRVLANPATFCSSISLILTDCYTLAWLDWEPEALYQALESDYRVPVGRLLADKVNAAASILTTDLYHKSLEAFLALNTVFNFRTVDPSMLNVCTLDDVAWGTTEARLLEGPEDFDKAGFSHDIAWYVGVLLSVEGIALPPPGLEFAEFDPVELDQRGVALAGDKALAEMYWQRQDAARKQTQALVAGNLDALTQEVNALPLEKPVSLDLRAELAKRQPASAGSQAG